MYILFVFIGYLFVSRFYNSGNAKLASIHSHTTVYNNFYNFVNTSNNSPAHSVHIRKITVQITITTRQRLSNNTSYALLLL